MKSQAHLYITASLDGFIADANGSTDWARNLELCSLTARKYGCICMGRVTYKKYIKVPTVHVIVLTRRIPKNHVLGVSFVSSPHAALACAQKLGFKKMLVVGGAQTNQSFMQAGLIKKMFVDTHSLLLGRGVYKFGDFSARFDTATLKQSWNKAGFMHTEYAVGKTHTSTVAVIMRDGEGNYLVQHLNNQVSIGSVGDVATTGHADQVAHTLVKKFTRTDFQLTECEVIDISTTHHFYLYEAIITRCPFSQRKVQWVNSQQLNQYIVDKKIAPQTAQIYSYYKQWL